MQLGQLRGRVVRLQAHVGPLLRPRETIRSPNSLLCRCHASVHFFRPELSSDTTENQVFRNIMTRDVVCVSETGARHTGEPSCGRGAAVTTAGVRETPVWPPVHFFRSELSSDATKNQVFRDIMTRGVVRASETGSRHSGEPSCGHGAAVTTAGVRETGAWPPVHFLKVFRWHLVAQAPPKYQIYLMDDGCFYANAPDRLNSQESERNFDIIKN